MNDLFHNFYGKAIYRDREQALIQKVLSKYKGERADEALKEKIWNELQKLKSEGTIAIPFKIFLKKDPSGKTPDVVEVVLDTKV